ncbi:MAG: hypothetical protein LBB49_00865, partial [Gracilibacteraceae bacterium]|nr:hypothetical protein [Gracilibacteraceae bacterium]
MYPPTMYPQFMPPPQYPHIRSKMNRAGAVILIYWAVSMVVSTLGVIIFMIIQAFQGVAQSAIRGDVLDPYALAESLTSDMMSDSVFMAFLLLLSPLAAYLTALFGGL